MDIKLLTESGSHLHAPMILSHPSAVQAHPIHYFQQLMNIGEFSFLHSVYHFRLVAREQ